MLRKAAALKRICGRCAPQNAANVNCQDGEEHTPLYHAKEKQRKNIQQLLLSNGANE